MISLEKKKWEFLMFCPKNFKGISYLKFTPASLARAAFYRGFLYKTRARLARAAFYRGFLYKTRASLARAAFNRDFLYNQKGNPLKKGVV